MGTPGSIFRFMARPVRFALKMKSRWPTIDRLVMIRRRA
jgi:hypothetical protein